MSRVPRQILPPKQASDSPTPGATEIIAPVARGCRALDLDTLPARPPRKAKTRNSKQAFTRAVERARDFLVAQQAPASSASDLVGLYAVLHEHVFKVLPGELEQDWMAACSSANKLVRDEFGGDYVAASRFVAWCWTRVRKRARHTAEGDDLFRPGWRYQFTGRVWMTDYKAQAARTR